MIKEIEYHITRIKNGLDKVDDSTRLKIYDLLRTREVSIGDLVIDLYAFEYILMSVIDA